MHEYKFLGKMSNGMFIFGQKKRDRLIPPSEPTSEIVRTEFLEYVVHFTGQINICRNLAKFVENEFLFNV